MAKNGNPHTVALNRSPEFVALEALLLSTVESFEQYKEH